MKYKIKKYQEGGRPLTFDEWYKKNIGDSPVDEQTQARLQEMYQDYISNYNNNPEKTETNPFKFDINNTGINDMAANYKPIVPNNTIQNTNNQTNNTSQSLQRPISTEGNFTQGPLNYNNFFQGLNNMMDITRGIGNMVNESKQRREERRKYLAAMYNNIQYNPNERGVNNVPVYFKYGGENKKEKFLFGGEGRLRRKLLKNPEMLQLGVMNNPEALYNLYPELGELVLSPDQLASFNQGTIKKEFLYQNAFNDGLITNNNYNNISTFTGTKQKMKFKEGGKNKNLAELEEGEIFQNIDGEINKIPEGAGTHEEGGSIQENVERVLEDTSDKRKDKRSKELLITPKEAKDLLDINLKSSVSHSKLFEKAKEKNDRELKKLADNLEINLKYAKQQNGGIHAENAMDENLKTINKYTTDQEIFDKIYDHQEEIKNNMESTKKFKYGGINKMAEGGDPTPNKYKWFTDKWGTRVMSKDGKPYDPKALPKGYRNKEYIKDLMTVLNQKTGNSYPTTEAGLIQMRADQDKNNRDFVIDSGERNYWNRNASTDFNYVDKKRPFYDAIGVEKDARNFANQGELDKWATENNFQFLKGSKSKGFYIDPDTGRYIGTNVNINGTEKTPTLINPQKPNIADLQAQINKRNALDIPAEPIPMYNTKIDYTPVYSKPKGATPSNFYEPLQNYDTAANVMGFIDSLNREPVELEQLRRLPIQARDLNALPTLLENLGDYNAVLNQLPTNGVGFANMANMAASKYKANNQVLGQYENINTQNRQRLDEINNNNQYQLDGTNLGLRDQFNNRVLQSRENQRLQKLTSLDAIFKTMAENRKLNREGNLVMQLTPYFNQYGEFNGNDYNIDLQSGASGVSSPNTEGVETVNGKKYYVKRDKNGNIIGQTEVTTTKPKTFNPFGKR